MKKRKILQFSIAATKGGRTQYILNNWNNINKEQFQFDFITFDSYLDFADELEKQGCKIFYIPCRPQQNIKLFREVFGDILEKGYDTLHISTEYWNGFEIEEIAKEYDVPQVIIHAHSSGFQKAVNEKEKTRGQAIHYEMRKLLSTDMATDFWACSKGAAEWVFGDRIPKHKIRILPNAIDTHKFAFALEKRRNVRRELDLEGRFVLGHVGRIELVKNHRFLINVFHEIIKIMPEAILLLVGDGTLRGQVGEQIRKLGLQKNVRMLGKRQDTDSLLQAMDVFLLPSLFEGFPIALVEAQTAGLPCIVADTVCKEAAITPLISYCPLMICEWVKKIQDIYGNSQRVRKSMHTEIAAAGYEIRKQIKELEELYERV